jgi:hypothetical protein
MKRQGWALSFALLAGVVAVPAAPADEAPPTFLGTTSIVATNFGLGGCADAAGDLFVVDGTRACIYVFDGGLGLMSIWGGYGTATGPLPDPVDVAITPTGFLYVLGSTGVQRYGPGQVFLGSFGQFGSGVGGIESGAAIALDPYGDVFVADAGARLVRRYRADGTWVAEWPLPSGPAAGVPVGVALDRSGHVYVLDAANLQVQVFSANGQWLDGWSVLGRMRSAGGVSVDEYAGLYLADPTGLRIVKYRTDGTFLSSWACNLGGGLSRVNDVVVGTRGRIYGVIGSPIDGHIEAFQYAATPATPVTWGAVKARYRGAPPEGKAEAGGSGP